MSEPLSITHPELAAQAVGWNPADFSKGMSQKLLWVCSRDHKYEASPNKRTQGRGCPICSGNRISVGDNDLATTHPDLAALAVDWDPTKYSKGSKIKVKWRCDSKKLPPHNYQMAIYAKVAGRGCAVCAGKQVVEGVNDLATTHPKIALEADGWDPRKYTAGSNKKVSWKCDLGHSSIKSVNQRIAAMASGCAVCENSEVSYGHNDIETLFPEIAAEAHGWDPRTMVPTSEKRVEWKCRKCHQIWSARISPRTQRGVGCPVCRNVKVATGINDCATTHPALAVQAVGWDPAKIFAGTKKILQYRCPECQTVFKSAGSNRVFGQGCPKCATHGYDFTKTGWLYLLRDEKRGLLKIGITNSVESRLRAHRKEGFKRIDLSEPMDGGRARSKEQDLLRGLKEKGAQFLNSEEAAKFSGFSECWMETSFSVGSLEELIWRVESDSGELGS